MAQRVIYTDDLDGSESPDVETRHFSLGTDYYSLDLSDANWDELRYSLKKFTDIADSSGPTPLSPKKKSHDNTLIREWAKDRGLSVKDRGKLPDEIIRQYEEEEGPTF